MTLPELAARVDDVERRILTAGGRLSGRAEPADPGLILEVAEEVSRLGRERKAALGNLESAKRAAKESERMATAALLHGAMTAWCTNNADLLGDAARLGFEGIQISFGLRPEDQPIVSLLGQGLRAGQFSSAVDDSSRPNDAGGRLVPERLSRRVGRYRGPDTLAILWERGVIELGTQLIVDPRRLPEGADAADSAYHATVGPNGRRLRWAFDGQEHAVSELAILLRDRYRVDVNANEANGNKYWCLADNPRLTLWELGEPWR